MTPRRAPPVAEPTIIPILLEATLAAEAATNWGLLDGVLVTDWVPVCEREVETEGISPGVFVLLKLWVRLGVAVRLPVKLGVLDPVDERDAVMVLVRVLDADEPDVADRVRVAVTVGEGVAPARERVAVAVPETVGATARERVAVPETVGATARERVAVAVPETVGAAARERVAVEETEIAARDLVAVSVADADTVTACERDAVALILPPPPEDGNGVCAQPADTANAKKKSLRIISLVYHYSAEYS
jgi:hypothetical protein